MTALVVDASAVVELLLTTDLGRSVARVIGPDDTLHAPDLLGVEFVSVVRRMLRSSDLTVSEADDALTTFPMLGVELYEHSPMLRRALELRESVTPYDAMYVVLAEALQSPLMTCDAKLAGSNGHRASIQLIKP